MEKTFIIAEIGNTHEGSVGLAKRFMAEAALCGVDAVKFQTHIFDAESLITAPNPPYFKDETRKEYFDRTAFSEEQYRHLKKYAEVDLGVEFISSPFSLEAVDLLENVGLSTYKVPSGEVTNIPLLEKLATTGKKILLSSGMSSWNELNLAVSTLQKNGCSDLVVLQCTSEYPCPAENSGLNVLKEISERFKVPTGYSDHTLGIEIPLAAVCLGARVIEKHFTLSNRMYGSDAKFATEPAEFKNLVIAIRNLEKALIHKVDKDLKASELQQMKTTFEKSIVLARDMRRGETIRKEDMAFKKPGNGISAKHYRELIGRVIQKDANKDTLLKEEDLI